MSFRKPFERRNRSSVRRASRALSRHLVPACVESLEERTLLSAVLPGLDDHGVIITNAQVAGQSQVIVDSRQNSDLSGNAGGSGLFINLNNAASVKTIRISEVTVSGNGNAGVQIRLANMTLDRLEIDRAVISGNGGAGLVIDLTNANIGQLIIHDSTNPTDPTQPNAPNSGASRIANNAFDGICVVARGVGVVSTIGTLRLNGNVVENNAGNGVLFNLNAVNVTNLDLFDNEVRTNTGNGVHFETNRTNLTGSVVRNTFTGNSAGTTTAGHGLSFFSQSLIGSTPSPAPSNFDFTAFSDNVFSNNAGAGVSVDLRTQTTWDATLLRNTFSGNQRLGFDLRAVDTLNAFDVKFGDIAVNPRLQLVNGNTFTNNVGAAIALDLNDASGNAGNTTGRFVILGNTITGTSALAGSTIYRGEGINIRARGSVALVNGAARYFGSTIDRNTILGNAGDGVRLTVSEDSELIDLLIGNNIDADGDGNVDRTFDVNGPDNFGGGDVLTRQGDGNVISGNGGNGISVIRLGSAYVQNARILDNRVTNNAEGVYLQASNTYITVPNAARFGLTATGVRTGVPTVNDFTVNNNDLSNNRANGVHLRTEANAVILADLRYNRIDSNAANGIRLTGLENVASDFENIGGTWVKNAITNNGQNGIAIENVVGSVNPLRIGLDGRDRADDQSLGNFIALNGEDGIEIGARPGIAGSQTPRDVRDGAEIVNNLIVDNGRNAVGSPHAAGKGIDVEVLITSHREFRIDRNVIQGNAGDGIELRNAGGLLRVSALGNFIDLNGGRGVDLLNQLGFINYNAEAFVRFGDAGTTTLLDGSTFTNRNIITNNGQEGFYVVNTPTREQTQDVPAENVLLQTSEDALEGLPVNLVLDLENNEIRDNGLGVPQLNSPGSRLTGTGLVIRVGTQVSSGSPFVAPDTSGNGFYFSSTDGTGFFTSTAAAGVGSNVIQGAGTVAIDTNDSGGVRVSGNGRVNARVVDNEFSGNVGDDVLMESFTALTPDTTAGAWSPTEFRIDSYDRDPLARLNLVFTGNKGDSIDVVRGWFTPEPTGSYTPGARFNNAEGDFKSRTPRNDASSGPFGGPGATRNRNGQRVAVPAFTPGVPASSSSFWYDGLGESTFRVEGTWDVSGFTQNQLGDDFTESEALGNTTTPFGRSDYAWDQVAGGTFSYLTAWINDVTVSEADGFATLRVMLSENAPSGGLRIYYRTADGTALADPNYDSKPGDGDYIPASGSVLIPAGQRFVDITVQLRTDSDDRTEQFYVDLFRIENAADPSFGRSGDFVDSRGIVTVVSPPRLSIDDMAVVEGDNGSKDLVFTVTLSAVSDTAITVDYSTGGGNATPGQDYVADSGTLTFLPGEMTKTIRIPVLGDLAPEANETFDVTLSNPTGGAIIAKATGQGTIIDEDTPTITISDVVVVEGDVGTKAATFNLVLSKAVAFPVTVQYTTADMNTTAGQDYAAVTSPRTVTFNPGETVKQITIDVIGDTTVEQLERFLVNLSNPTNATIQTPTAVGAIVDNDTPAITVTSRTALEGTDQFVIFTVRLSKAVNTTVTVQYTTSDQTAVAGEDYEGVTTPQTLTFAAGETSKEVRVRVFNDTLLEPTETFALNLSNPTNATLPASPAVGTILDDDTPTITIDDVSVLESEGFAVFTVRLSKPLAADTVTVDFATRADTAFDGSDFFGRFGTIVFQPGETVKQVAVRIVSDNVREPLERFFVDLSNPFNGTLAKGIGTVRILDQPAPIGLVVAPNVGFEPLVKVYDARGDQVRLQFYAYAPTFRGGVRVATGGDVNGDGITDIVVSPVQGPAPVRVFDGLTGALLQQYFPFTSAFTGGLSVAMGDVTGDGLADVIVGIASQGGAVRVFDGPTGRILAAWYAFSPSFAGGLSVAAGDITGDGRVEVFAGILSQGGPSVVVRDALTGAFRSGFSAYNPAFTGGVNVAAGDIDGDGLAEAVVSLASQGDAVRVFSFVPQGNGTYSAAIRSAYNVFSPAFTGGITVGVTDIDFDGRAEVIAAPASGSQTAVRFFDGLTGRLLKFALPYPASFTGGAFVAGQTYPGVQPLRLDGAALASSAEPAVTQAQVAALAKEAARRLAAAGASAADLAKLATVTIAVADLPGTYLGQARPGSVVIDVNAGGHGWFVDATPDRDEEFARGTDGVYRAVAPQAKGRIDLLTVLTHELAHQLGFRDLDPATSPNSLMTATLGKSVRRATKEHVDDLFAADDLLEELLTV